MQELADNGSSAARAVLELRDRPERFLATVQIGITVVGATAAAIGGHSSAGKLTPVLEKIPAIAPFADDIALVLVIAAISYLSIVLGELVPKSLALRGAERYALLVGRFLRVLASVARPFVWFLTLSSNLVLKPFGDRTTFTESQHSADELQQLLEKAAKTGSVHPQASEIASRALGLPELSAADVMVPRQEVVMLPRHASPEQIRDILLENTHSRMPVFEGQVDNVVGYISIKDLLAVAWQQRLIILEDLMRPAYFVPETKKAVELLHEMRNKHMSFAIVVDEQGGVSGIITMEDLLEELVGDIFSEHVKNIPEHVKREATGTVLVSGSTPVRDLNRELGIELPEGGEWVTVAGLCIELVERIPNVGERIPLPGGIELEVVEASPRRLETVRLRLPTPAPS